jgi:hypothetical protein
VRQRVPVPPNWIPDSNDVAILLRPHERIGEELFVTVPTRIHAFSIACAEGHGLFGSHYLDRYRRAGEQAFGPRVRLQQCEDSFFQRPVTATRAVEKGRALPVGPSERICEQLFVT